MKDKIIMLIIGIIIGAVLAGACFWFATSINKPDNVNNDFSNSIDKGGMRPDKNLVREEVNEDEANN